MKKILEGSKSDSVEKDLEKLSVKDKDNDKDKKEAEKEKSS